MPVPEETLEESQETLEEVVEPKAGPVSEEEAIIEPETVELEEPTASPYAALGVPELDGRSPEEIAHLVSTMRESQRKLSKRLDTIHDEQQQEVEPPSSEDFYADPMAAMRQVVKEEMAATVQPFRENLHESAIERAFDAVRSDPRYPDFGEYEAYVRTTLEQGSAENMTNPNAIVMTYLASRGMRGLAGEGAPAAAPAAQHRVTVPPHQSPNSPPPPASTKAKPRQLNEEEREAAKVMKMSPDEYRMWLEKGETDETGKGYYDVHDDIPEEATK